MNKLKYLFYVFGVCGLFVTCFPRTANAEQLTTQPGADTRAFVNQVVDAAGGQENLLQLFRMTEKLKVGSNPDKPAKERVTVVEPPNHWWLGKRDRVAKGQEPAIYLVWAWTLQAIIAEESKLQLLPELLDHERPLVGVRVSGTIEPAMDLYFDNVTHQLVRIDWRDDIHRLSDWIEHDGVRYPSKCEGFKKAASKPWYRTEILQLERLSDLPDGLKR
jgi:hypothetical protein